MKAFKKLMIGFFLCWGFSCVAVQAQMTDYSNDTISQGMSHLINQFNQKHNSNLNIGVIVQSLPTGRTLYEYRDNFLFTPASVQKLFTASAALVYLKPNYQFVTELLSTGKVIQGVLEGDLYVKFAGDPELQQQDIEELIKHLTSLGIRQIAGNIYIDNTEYNNVPYPPGCIWDDLSYNYGAPVNAIIINRNKFTLHFFPTASGKSPILKADLPPGVAKFTNNMITTRQYHRDCPIVIYSDLENHYTVGGCLSSYYKEQSRSLAVRNMFTYTQALLRQILQENHIIYTKKITVRSTPANARIVASHSSPPLQVILKEMLKDSDNLTANSLFKKMSELYYHVAGNWQEGVDALKMILSPLTYIDFKHGLLTDGAGLSRYNLVSPYMISQLLHYDYQHSEIRSILMNTLPIAGRDGTLAYRLPQFARGSLIHAKTGSMTGVTALAGYIHSRHNKDLSFVIMINGFVNPRIPYIDLENNICKLLVNARKE